MKKIDWVNLKEKFRNINKKRLAVFFSFGLFLIILVWAFVTAGIITSNFNRSQLEGSGDNQGVEVQGVILTETKDDTKYWELYGETGAYNTEDKIALIDRVTGNFYKDNEVAMSFNSTKGTYNETKKEIILYDKTFVVLRDDTTLNCDRLVWSGSDKPIVVTGNIVINHKNQLVSTANKAYISPDYNVFRIVGKTSTKIYDLKEKK